MSKTSRIKQSKCKIKHSVVFRRSRIEIKSLRILIKDENIAKVIKYLKVNGMI